MHIAIALGALDGWKQFVRDLLSDESSWQRHGGESQRVLRQLPEPINELDREAAAFFKNEGSDRGTRKAFQQGGIKPMARDYARSPRKSARHL